MATKQSVRPDSTETSVKPASKTNSIKNTEIPEKKKNEERNAPIRNTDTILSQQPASNLSSSSQNEKTPSNLQRVEEASVNGQSTPVFENWNPSTSQHKEDLGDNDQSEVKKDQPSPLLKKSESENGGLQPGPGSEVIVNPKPVHKPEKFNLVVIHCFLSSNNTFSYSFKNGSVAQNVKSIKDYVDVQNRYVF